MPLQVSVVIPTYNQNPAYLQEAIESALNQTYPKNLYEILVVDDGSTRITPDEVVAKFKDEKQVRLIKKEHGGIAHTLNTGIKQMRGQHFKWLSSDDALCEDALEILMSNAGNERQIVYGDWMKMDENGNPLDVFREKVFLNSAEMKKFVWHYYFGNADATLIPRSAFKTVGLFNQSIRFYEDYDWLLKAVFLHNYSFVHTDKIIAKYRVHSNQITNFSEKHAYDSMMSYWRIRRNIYLTLDTEARLSVNPPATLLSFVKKAFSFKVASIYRKFSGTNDVDRARIPHELRKMTYKLLMVK
jgi:glycosyltransferase involved in cell wall biosynthesis